MEGDVLKCLLWRLKALREERGWTQEKFAEVAGMSYKYYQAVEAGRKKDLRLSTLERLAEGHEIEVWLLLAPIGRGTKGSSKNG
ncbi:helix-turn-helix transcriptional regulator [Akkermansiaceae bacterium]|nr:helix-turn-helix transcriptional regulator [Akkermansiaceae bacterium]